MDNWDELRTAYEVARHGTVSGAAAALGVHHATAIRHVDALEARLGVKLFQRHARGYTPTEAGEDLARIVSASDEQFAQLAARLTGQGAAVTGELVLTTLTGLAPRIVPMLAGFQAAHPGVRLRLRTGQRIFRLEYGEAHVAIRAGNPPQEQDNVAQRLATLAYRPYAAPAYIARHGKPGEDFAGPDLAEHDFIGPDDEATGSPFLRWVLAHIAPNHITFRADDETALEAAVRAGLGIGFLPVDSGDGLVPLAATRPEWSAPLWLVTHVDLHRSAKVQALAQYLKAAFADASA